MFIRSMHGLGDNIYQRAFARHFRGAYIDTPFPELYEDIGLKCVRPVTSLRTQAKNVIASEYQWYARPCDQREIKIAYGHNELNRGSIPEAMRKTFGVEPVFDLPDFDESPVIIDKPIAVIRPVTLRREWLNSARSPLPEYIATATEILKGYGFYTVSIADVDGKNEWSDGELPETDESFHKGELNVKQLLSLVKNAELVLGGVGWIVPATISAKTRGYFICGGNGAHNAPEKVTDRSMDLSKIEWAVPDNFCRCSHKIHNCDKIISGFYDKFTAYLDKEF